MDIHYMKRNKPTIIEGNFLKSSLADQPFPRDIQGDICLLRIYIKDGSIQRITNISEAEKDFQSTEAVRINIPQNQVIVPAFVDCHVHLVLDGIHGFRKFIGPVSDEILEQRLNSVIFAGVAAVRDGSDHFNTGIQAKELCKRILGSSTPGKEEPGSEHLPMSCFPEVVTTGWAIYREGHYGAFLGRGGIREVGEVRNKIRQLNEAGVDQVKVAQSGLVSFNVYGETDPAQFTLREMKEIVSIAGDYNLPVMVHASSDEAVRIAVEAGAHSVEHGYFVSPRTLERMAEKGVSWVPTVAPVAAALKEAESTGGQQGRVNPEVLKKTIQNHLEKIQLAHQMGVLIGIGTDAGSPGVGWDSGYWQEMGYYARAGLSVETILEMASRNGAKILGLHEDMGTIEVGKKPYLISIKAKSLKDMERFQGPLSVFHCTG